MTSRRFEGRIGNESQALKNRGACDFFFEICRRSETLTRMAQEETELDG